MDDTGNSEDENSESSSGVFWRDILFFILICISITLMERSGCLCKIWLLVHIRLLATLCLVSSEEFWYPRWINHQASPALYQRSGCMKYTLWKHPEGRHVVK